MCGEVVPCDGVDDVIRIINEFEGKGGEKVYFYSRHDALDVVYTRKSLAKVEKSTCSPLY
jgi:hypothetical protein